LPTARLTEAQRAYLAAFDLHLKARDDRQALATAQRRTSAALVALGRPPRSDGTRRWLDRLLVDIARLGGPRMPSGGRKQGF
jgi:hypothetical protein